MPNPIADIVKLAETILSGVGQLPRSTSKTSDFAPLAISQLVDVAARRLNFLVVGTGASWYPLADGYAAGARTGSAWTDGQQMTQATSGAKGDLDARHSSDSVMVLANVVGTADATHAWTGGGATFVPTTAPLTTGWSTDWSGVEEMAFISQGDFTLPETPVRTEAYSVGQDAAGNDVLRFIDDPGMGGVPAGGGVGSGASALNTGDVVRVIASGKHVVTAISTTLTDAGDQQALACLLAALRIESVIAALTNITDQSSEEDMNFFDAARVTALEGRARAFRNNFNRHFGLSLLGEAKDADTVGSTAYAVPGVLRGDVIRYRHTHSRRWFG